MATAKNAKKEDHMATTINRAKAKLAAKIPTMPDSYNQAMADFFGVSTGVIAGSAPGKGYAAKISPGMENTWETNLKRAFGV